MKNLKNARMITMITLVLVIGSILSSCSSDSGGEYLAMKGVEIGPFSQARADQGQKIFQMKCASCHKYDVKLVGPPLGKVVERRSVDYIISQILNPEKMIANNDTTKALLAKYLTQMPNQHLNMIEAKAVYDHLRAVANAGGKL